METTQNTLVQYRAIVRTPASYLAPAEDRRRGYVLHPSEPQTSMEEVKRSDYDLRRSEETWASVERWEKRTVVLGDWEEV